MTNNLIVERRTGGTVEYQIPTANKDAPIKVFVTKRKEGKRYRILRGRGKGTGCIILDEKEFDIFMEHAPTIARIESESEDI